MASDSKTCENLTKSLISELRGVAKLNGQKKYEDNPSDILRSVVADL
jgi:hypothetical protein